MLRSTEQIIDQHLNDHIIRDRDLALLFSGSPARRYALINKQPIYLASPLRALMDYMYLHKIKNADIDFLTISLRIHKSYCLKISRNEIDNLSSLYKSGYVK